MKLPIKSMPKTSQIAGNLYFNLLSRCYQLVLLHTGYKLSYFYGIKNWLFAKVEKATYWNIYTASKPTMMKGTTTAANSWSNSGVLNICFFYNIIKFVVDIVIQIILNQKLYFTQQVSFSCRSFFIQGSSSKITFIKLISILFYISKLKSKLTYIGNDLTTSRTTANKRYLSFSFLDCFTRFQF